jgi:hypothetical protein
VIALGVALALVLTGALLAMLGSAWVGMGTTDRLTLAGIMFVVILILLGLDPFHRRLRGD